MVGLKIHTRIIKRVRHGWCQSDLVARELLWSTVPENANRSSKTMLIGCRLVFIYSWPNMLMTPESDFIQFYCNLWPLYQSGWINCPGFCGVTFDKQIPILVG